MSGWQIWAPALPARNFLRVGGQYRVKSTTSQFTAGHSRQSYVTSLSVWGSTLLHMLVP